MLPNGGGDGKAFACLTLEEMRKFNENVPDVEGVKYFSWGAVYEPGLIDTWKYPHSVILEKEGPNDGLVSVESAKWGTYLGTLHHVNHLDLVGWINSARYKWAEILGKEIKFRPATFYLGIADMLAKEVEGQKDEGEGEGEQVEGAKITREEREDVGKNEGKEGVRSQSPEPGSSSGSTITPTQSGNATPMAASRSQTQAEPKRMLEREETPPQVREERAEAQGRMLDSIDRAEKQQGGEGLKVEGESRGHQEEARQHKAEEEQKQAAKGNDQSKGTGKGSTS